jgi:hypothetical protein
MIVVCLLSLAARKAAFFMGKIKNGRPEGRPFLW